MHILKAVVENFASYKHLEIKLSNQSLVLVSGPTGAGKSTICDIIPWILFGKTAKNGAADEVCNWNTTKPTTGTLELEVHDVKLIVHRSRRPNDLYIVSKNETIRGKDLTETQVLLNHTLNLTYEKYLAGAYLHEFSQSMSFFTSIAKVRRLIIDQIIDLSFPKKLTEKSTEGQKSTSKQIAKLTQELPSIDVKAHLALLHKQKDEAKKWEQRHAASLIVLQDACYSHTERITSQSEIMLVESQTKLSKLEAKINTITNRVKPQSYFDAKRMTIEFKRSQLSTEPCKACGAPSSTTQDKFLAEELQALLLQNSKNQNDIENLAILENELLFERAETQKNITKLKSQKNPYISQLEVAEKETNPFDSSIAALEATLIALYEKEKTILENLAILKSDLADVELIKDSCTALQVNMVHNTVLELENGTNTILNDYFDAEFKITLSADNPDKIDLVIHKDGYEASFLQLSKGQRQLLKLSFGMTVMKIVQLHNNVQFSSVFFDEALDGLDDNLKLKSFRLFNSLTSNYESIFVVEHNDALKSLFSNTIAVSLNEGVSQLAET